MNETVYYCLTEMQGRVYRGYALYPLNFLNKLCIPPVSQIKLEHILYASMFMTVEYTLHLSCIPFGLIATTILLLKDSLLTYFIVYHC